MSTIPHENERILTLMADGSHRSFDALQVSLGTEAARLHGALKMMLDNGLLERDVEKDAPSYLITLKGLIASEGLRRDDTPFYQE